MNCIEICAGGGGQALGLEMAGFEPLILVDNDVQSCNTLRANRPNWNVVCEDVSSDEIDFSIYKGDVVLLAGGVTTLCLNKRLATLLAS